MHCPTDFLSSLRLIQHPVALSPVTLSGESPSARAGAGLADLLLETAGRRSEQPVVSTSEQTLSYGDLILLVRRIAGQLSKTPGFETGSRVLLLVPNSVEYIAAFYAVLFSGGVVVPVPANTESGTLRNILESTQAICTITTSQVLRRHPDLEEFPAEGIDLQKSERGELSENSMKPVSRSAENLAAIFFTAGSSGTPKGVMLSHGNLISNAQSIQEYLQLQADERPLCILPFHHAFGNSVLQSHLLQGAHLVLDGNTIFPESILEAMIRHECTSLSAVPDLFRILLERTSLKQTRFPHLRYMSVAGGALPHAQAVEISNVITPARFFVMYGQTEATARLAYVPPDQLDDVSDGTIGQAIPGVALQVVDERGQEVEAGTVGELRARGPNIMQGYWRDAEETRKRVRNGWLYTGDLATLDQSGRVVIKGRRNSLVKISGYRVHPADLEQFALRTFPLSQAVAVPFEAKKTGTRLALYIETISEDAELTEAEMLSVCRSQLPRQLVPDRIRILQKIPLNHAMKVDRVKLSELAAVGDLQS
ncbi:Long-chain-fatty-acid--CoA ligase [Gimesia panareensis]|uniref:Long-chain-fatty-acid--CoA ligase n=1 Tax=Gimesia panareensis TaxID=2527978 RepID=A0A518FWP3_9PLAN|nr:class I adenylate-forming enzyme family protein [Gimesia panareensis]QDV20754.1 Long-chain-fatty-acid--CoA ligase [Gimesia panareensis]